MRKSNLFTILPIALALATLAACDPATKSAEAKLANNLDGFNEHGPIIP